MRTSFRRTAAALALSAAAFAGAFAGTGATVAAPTTVNITSTYLFLADPFPFGVASLKVTADGSGKLKMSTDQMCAALNLSACSVAVLPMHVAWLNLSTGQAGTLTVNYGRPAVVPTGRGLIAITNSFGAPAVPGVGTINA